MKGVRSQYGVAQHKKDSTLQQEIGSRPEAKAPRQIRKLDSGIFVKDILQMRSEAVTGMFTHASIGVYSGR